MGPNCGPRFETQANLKQANHVSGRQILIKFCFKIKRGDGLLQAFSGKYTVCIHCLYTVCIRKPYLGYLCSCMRSVYEKKAGYSVYALYPHRQISFTPGVHRQISRNFAALRAQANLKSKLIEHAFTPSMKPSDRRCMAGTVNQWLDTLTNALTNG